MNLSMNALESVLKMWRNSLKGSKECYKSRCDCKFELALICIQLRRDTNCIAFYPMSYNYVGKLLTLHGIRVDIKILN